MQVICQSFSLEQLIHSGSSPAIHRLSEDLFTELESANAEKRWFSDIGEKEIFCSRDGLFGLSVAGNTVPSTILPDTAIYAGKEYWMPVFSYLIGRVRLSELQPGELPGILFNYLQAMFLILRVRLVFIDKEGHYNSASLFDQLPIILDKLVPEFRSLFTRLLTKRDKTPSPAELRRIRALFIEKVVTRPAEDEVVERGVVTRGAVGRGALTRGALGRGELGSNAGSVRRNRDYLQNGDLLVAVILAVTLSFSAWVWSGQ